MSQKLSYWLDKDNTIRKVDDFWDDSMDSESWSDRACSKTIIGRHLFDFICDDPTRMYVSALVQLVRIIPQCLFRPYRCDTPNSKRYMRMIVSPEENDLVRVSHELLHCEPLPKKISFLTQNCTENKSLKRRNGTEYLGVSHIRCSLCNRLQPIGTNLWQEVDTLSDLMATTQDTVPVVYGICPSCIEGLPKK